MNNEQISMFLTFRTLATSVSDCAIDLDISITDSKPSLLMDIFSLLLSSFPFS